jgi:hypothetical protein
MKNLRLRSTLELVALGLVAAGCASDGLQWVPVGAPDSGVPDLRLAPDLASPSDLAPHCAPGTALAAPMTIPFRGAPRETLIGQFDGKPGNDVAVNVPMSVQLWVFPGAANGPPGAPIVSMLGDFASGLAAGDFDRDGVADLVGTPPLFDGAVTIQNDGHGRFVSSSFLILDGAGAIRVADLDGDGRLDFAGRDFSNADVIHRLLNRSTGGMLRFDDSPFIAPIDSQALPGGFALADLTGDGRPELLFTTFGLKSALVVVHNTAGTWKGTDSYPIALDSAVITTADVDGDKRLDVILGSSTGGAALLRNAGDHLAAAESLPVPSGMGRLEAGDVDGDHALDLVHADAKGDRVGVLFNDGGGHFGAPELFPAGRAPTGFAVGDLDGDGRADVSVANPDVPSVTILYARCR